MQPWRLCRLLAAHPAHAAAHHILLVGVNQHAGPGQVLVLQLQGRARGIVLGLLLACCRVRRVLQPCKQQYSGARASRISPARPPNNW